MKLREKLNSLGERYSAFFYGRYFPIYLALAICFCYTANLSILGLLICSLFATAVFLFYEDTSPVIPILFMVVLTFRDYTIMANPFSYLTVLPAIISFIARLWIYPIKKFKNGKLVIPFIVLTVSFVLSGAFMPGYNVLKGLAPTLTLGPVMLLIYMFFMHGINPPKNFDIKKYLCYCLIVTALTMIMHVAVVRICFPDDLPELGWANINTSAAFLCLAIPACYYLIIKVEKILPFLFILAILYLSLLIITSDAVLGLVVLFSPLLLFYTYRNLRRKDKKLFIYFIILAVGVVVFAAVLLFYTKGIDYVLAKVERMLSDNGRLPLYMEALKLFPSNPLFGVGAGYANYDTELITNGVRLYNFHSTFFHVLATMGIFGIVAYVIYFIKRFKILMKNYNAFSVCMLIGFIIFECYSMVDACEFNAIPLMSTVTVIITIVEITNKGNEQCPLPLALNRKNGYNF